MKITISVPKPCHEDWEAMSPATHGRHCDKCEHTVMDLTRVSDAQLIDLFRKDALPKCARFTQGQLDRVIALEERAPRLIPAAAVGLAMAFASPEAEAQTCSPMVGKMMVSQPVPTMDVKIPNVTPLDTADQIIERIQMGQPAIPVEQPDHIITGDTVIVPVPELMLKGEMDVRPSRSADTHYYIDGVRVQAAATPAPMIEEVRVITGGIPGTYGDVAVMTNEPVLDPGVHVTVSGRVVDDKGESLPFVNVNLGTTPYAVVSDVDGRFRIDIPEHLLNDPTSDLRFTYLGYGTRSVPLTNLGSAPPPTVATTGEHVLNGDVVDKDGNRIAGCIVEVEGLGLRCTTNADGYFGFDLPKEIEVSALTVRAIVNDGATGHVIVPVHSLPRCIEVPVSANGKAVPPTVRPPHTDLGDVVLNEDRTIQMMGEMIIMREKPTVGERVAQPFKWLGRQVAKPFH